MKRNIQILTMVGSLFLLQSCGGSESSTSTPEATETKEVVQEKPAENKFLAGQEVYTKTCQPCHQPDGKGMPDAFPPLAGSDYLLEDLPRAIQQVIHGSSGEITVNGQVFNGVMPPQVLTDQEITDVLNYVLNTWGNDGGTVTLEEVIAGREV
ncbi:cytochrome c [Putridiphycobacter roseus]|uniref:Cytochrome c n=1 Tax=Putridiphycobacter roseus TaxID=2219161 RepID=A0A2W1NQ19_9FLAO|nr:cytochrome c [Putridiphycobacter roseus]PZE17722.1 cytochrome c [Putridiphycobacter roseus]